MPTAHVQREIDCAFPLCGRIEVAAVMDVLVKQLCEDVQKNLQTHPSFKEHKDVFQLTN